KPYQLSSEEWDAYLRNRVSRMRTAERQGAVVAVESSQKPFQQRAQDELHRKLDDRIVPEHELQDVLSGLVTSTAIPGASYEWQNEPGKPQGYKVEFTPRPGDQILVRPSLRYQWSSGEPDRGSLRLSISAVFKNAYKSRIVGAVDIGYDPGVRPVSRPRATASEALSTRGLERGATHNYGLESRQATTRIAAPRW